MITITFNNDEKLYIQIYQHIANQIKYGKIKSGEKLPSKRTLAQNLGVGLNTVISAYNQLLDEGYIVSRERSGYYVDKIVVAELADKYDKKDLPPPPDDKIYKYNLKYSHTDKTKLPMTVLKNALQNSMAKSVEADSVQKRGLVSLRMQIAKYLQERRNVSVSWEDIIVTSGFNQTLSIINSLIPMAKYAIEDPCYKTQDNIIKSFGKTSHKIPVDKYGFSVKDLENTDANTVITTPNHQFPTGIMMGIRRRQRLLNWAEKEKNRYIIEDDYNSDFKYQGMPIPALKSLDKTGRVILSGSFSQTIGKFIQLSFLVLPEFLSKKLEKSAIYVDKVSLLSQYMLEDFMASGDFERHLNRMNTHYRKKRQLIIKNLSKRKSIKILGSDAGLHLIVEMDENVYDMENFDKIMAKNDIFIERVSDYSYAPYPKNRVIIGFGAIDVKSITPCLDEIFRLLSL